MIECLKLFDHKKAAGKAVEAKAPEKAAQGDFDLADISSVVSEFESPLLRYVDRILGSSASEREDVVQETFIRLYSQITKNGTQSIENPASWLFRVARNLSMDLLRRRSVDRRAQEKAVTGLEEKTGAEEGPADGLEQMLQREAGDAAMEELARLPGPEKEVLELKLLKDLKLREISHVTGVSVSMAGYRLNRGLDTIRNRLKERGIF